MKKCGIMFRVCRWGEPIWIFTKETFFNSVEIKNFLFIYAVQHIVTNLTEELDGSSKYKKFVHGLAFVLRFPHVRWLLFANYGILKNPSHHFSYITADCLVKFVNETRSEKRRMSF